MAGEGGVLPALSARVLARGRSIRAGMRGFRRSRAAAVGVPYAKDGSRFLGANFDVSGLYRFNAVQDWLAQEKLSVAEWLRPCAGKSSAVSSGPNWTA